MSLISCLTCGHECSKSEKACPNCGQPDPTSLPPTVYEKIDKYTNLSFLVIGLFVFITWLFAPEDKFFMVMLAGLAIWVLIFFSGVLLNLIINWKRTIGFIFSTIALGYGYSFYENHEYLKVFIAGIFFLLGVWIFGNNEENK